jgi:hypothetical protein
LGPDYCAIPGPCCLTVKEFGWLDFAELEQANHIYQARPYADVRLHR